MFAMATAENCTRDASEIIAALSVEDLFYAGEGQGAVARPDGSMRVSQSSHLSGCSSTPCPMNQQARHQSQGQSSLFLQQRLLGSIPYHGSSYQQSQHSLTFSSHVSQQAVYPATVTPSNSCGPSPFSSLPQQPHFSSQSEFLSASAVIGQDQAPFPPQQSSESARLWQGRSLQPFNAPVMRGDSGMQVGLVSVATASGEKTVDSFRSNHGNVESLAFSAPGREAREVPAPAPSAAAEHPSTVGSPTMRTSHNTIDNHTRGSAAKDAYNANWGAKQVAEKEGFRQQKYLKFRTRALEERRQMGPGRSNKMNALFKFWSYFLRTNFEQEMYEEFKAFAIQDAVGCLGDNNINPDAATPRDQAYYGMECLFRFYSFGLERRFSRDLYDQFEHLAISEFNDRGMAYGLHKLHQFHNHQRNKDEPIAVSSHVQELLDSIVPVQEKAAGPTFSKPRRPVSRSPSPSREPRDERSEKEQEIGATVCASKAASFSSTHMTTGSCLTIAPAEFRAGPTGALGCLTRTATVAPFFVHSTYYKL